MTGIARFFALFFALLCTATRATAYIPAHPTNETGAAAASGLNVTEESRIELFYRQGCVLEWDIVDIDVQGPPDRTSAADQYY